MKPREEGKAMQAPMRKHQREITDLAQIEEILERSKVLHLAMCRDGQPYLVPLNFGYRAGGIYLHSGLQGLKMEVLRANPRVCFEVCLDVEPVPAALPCAWSCHYRSVIGFGTVVEITEPQDRIDGISAIVSHYAGPGHHEIAPEAFARTVVLRIDIESITGKRHQAPSAPQ